MSKELDYLDKILNYQPLTLVERTIIECIKEKIQRLEAIDNAKPSEALESLRLLEDFEWHNKLFKEQFPDLFNTIKQALLEAQEMERLLDHERELNDHLILKSQEQEKENIKLKGQVKYLTEVATEFQKVLKSIFEKNVDIKQLKHYIEIYSDDIALKTYNGFHDKNEELTQEEFDLLKRYCECKSE